METSKHSINKWLNQFTVFPLPPAPGHNLKETILGLHLSLLPTSLQAEIAPPWSSPRHRKSIPVDAALHWTGTEFCSMIQTSPGKSQTSQTSCPMTMMVVVMVVVKVCTSEENTNETLLWNLFKVDEQVVGWSPSVRPAPFRFYGMTERSVCGHKAQTSSRDEARKSKGETPDKFKIKA